MANNYFKFKQFTVNQELAAMKVGTDGVLLGSIASNTEVKNVLDIGTGTGLIALMIAQRFAEALVEAIEIDCSAAEQANKNFAASPFAERLTCVCCDISIFKTEKRYDLIVCNPPYFIDSLKAPDNQRNLARHTISLTYSDLAIQAKRLLANNGVVAVIVPADSYEILKLQMLHNDLFEINRVDVRPLISKPIKRVVAHFCSKADKTVDTKELIIEESRHVYTPEFRRLTSDFYIK